MLSNEHLTNREFLKWDVDNNFTTDRLTTLNSCFGKKVYIYTCMNK